MNIDTIALATRAKGLFAFLKRARSIVTRYGLTPEKMDRAMQLFIQTLQRFDCRASVALTAVVLERHRDIITSYLNQDIEFVVHGYTHIDYSRLPPAEQLAHLCRAHEMFSAAGITATGFRSPYLRRGPHLDAAIKAAGFSYVCNQPIMWDVLDTAAFAPSTHNSYERALNFYTPWFANERFSLPRLDQNLVEIPVSLPDDEILVERLQDESHHLIEQTWRRILSETYRQGELFTIQLHPERIALCVDSLCAVLSEAHSLTPSVWVACLNEIDTWWRARAAAEWEIRETDNGAWRLSVVGPPGTTILARGVEIAGPVKPWADGYQRVAATTCTVRAAYRPLIGVSPACPPALISFLRQQGYLVQVSDERQLYSIYLDQTEFTVQDERALLTRIEQTAKSLVRLSRWPYGARSALCITGDIDALTLWDYGLRIFGR